MPLDLIRFASRELEPHTLTLSPTGIVGDAGLRIEGWERDHPRLAVWPSAWLVDEARPWLVPTQPGPVAFNVAREYEIQQGSVLQSRPGWLAMVGMEIGGAIIRTESRPMDHCWALCLPELIAALRERASVAWWGAGVQVWSLCESTATAPTTDFAQGRVHIPNPPRQ
jgi:hypothetical protein